MVKGKSKKTTEPDALTAYYNQIKNTPVLSFEEELDLARKIETGDSDARNKLIESNLRLVIKIARAYKAPDIGLLDLVQEGNLGLMKAVDKFDYRRNVRFCTYAAWWIKQAIVRSLSNKRRTIRLPHRKEEALRKVNKIMNYLSQRLMRDPDVSEIAIEAGMTEKNVEEILQFTNTIISLDGDQELNGGSVKETLEDYSYDPNRELMAKSLKEETRKVLDKLMEREKKILLYRFAFEGGKKLTLKTISEELGISQETVRQIELRALRKLKETAGELMEYCYC